MNVERWGWYSIAVNVILAVINAGIADAKEYRAHVFTTGIVFAALLAQWFDFPLDRVAALIIVVAIGKTGWDLLADGGVERSKPSLRMVTSERGHTL